MDNSESQPGNQQQPTPKHNGKLEVLYHIERPNGSLATCIALEDACGNFLAHLTPKQALSLLVWLRENEAILEKLAKEQVQ